MRALFRLLALALACCVLAGCTSGMPVVSKEDSATLPPAQSAYAAPFGDAQQESTQTVAMYLPNLAGTRLIAQYEKLSLSAAKHPADAVVRRLLAHPGTDDALPLSQDIPLQLAPGRAVEVSGGVATVNLAVGAVRLAHSELFVVCQAIANTLSQWGDIQYVNVLISGAQPGLDAAASMPAGCFSMQYEQDVGTLYERAIAQKASLSQEASTKRFSAVAALYFPAQGGKGVLSEARSLSFDGQTQPQMIQTLLSALSAGAQTLPGLPSMPDLGVYLLDAPVVRDDVRTGDRLASLSFDSALNMLLIEAGVPRSVMLAAVTNTLTGFLPGLDGLEVTIGDERVTAIVPAGIYEGAGEIIAFEDGVMRRGDFEKFLLSYCALYFKGGDHLVRVLRPVPCDMVQNARYLFNQLLAGPQPYDSKIGLSAVLPEGMSDADLLGVAFSGSAAIVNLSSAFRTACAGFPAERERLMVYSLVNTLTELTSVRRVTFFVGGAQPETFAGEIYLPGEFFENVGIVSD